MARMKKAEANVLAEQIRRFRSVDGGRSLKVTCDHFVKLGYKRDTIEKMTKRIERTGETQRKKQPGRTPDVNTPRKQEKVGKMYVAIKWRYLSYQVAKQCGAELMCRIRQKVRKLGRDGYDSLF